MSPSQSSKFTAILLRVPITIATGALQHGCRHTTKIEMTMRHVSRFGTPGFRLRKVRYRANLGEGRYLAEVV